MVCKMRKLIIISSLLLFCLNGFGQDDFYPTSNKKDTNATDLEKEKNNQIIYQSSFIHKTFTHHGKKIKTDAIIRVNENQ